MSVWTMPAPSEAVRRAVRAAIEWELLVTVASQRSMSRDSRLTILVMSCRGMQVRNYRLLDMGAAVKHSSGGVEPYFAVGR